MSDEYKKVNIDTGDATQWNPKKNDELEGLYVDKKSDVGENHSNIYTVQIEDGSYVSFWGSAMIDDNFDKIPMGAEVKLVYLGTQKNAKGNREYKKFDIFSKQVKTPSTNADSDSDSEPEEDLF